MSSDTLATNWAPGEPKRRLIEKIQARGGWVNAHAHIDRSFILNDKNYALVNGNLKQKWGYPDEYKKAASVDDIYDNMSMVVDDMITQGVQAIGSFIDADPLVEDKAIRAAKRLRENYADKIELRFINQTVKGALSPEARHWIEVAGEFVDFIGGLPEKDQGREAEHLDVLFEVAKNNGGKPLHIHVDQLNMPDQRDTETLLQKTIEHGYQGKVVAVHSISVGAQPRDYRHDLYQKMADAGIIVVACPTAWIDNSWVGGLGHDVNGPIHNALTPVKEMVAAGLTVAIGTDGIQDIYKPFNEGDMWTELRFLLEASRIYDMDILADIATINGRKALFLD